MAAIAAKLPRVRSFRRMSTKKFGGDVNLKALSARISLTSVHGQLVRYFPNALWHGDPQRHEIALTFDDGPNAETTPLLLALLDHYGVKATFFHVGERAAKAIETVQEVARAGHQIGL